MATSERFPHDSAAECLAAGCGTCAPIPPPGTPTTGSEPDKERRDSRVTHGRHCPCSACRQEDWPSITGPCGMHGAGCPAVYDPYPPNPPVQPRTHILKSRYLELLGKEAELARISSQFEESANRVAGLSADVTRQEAALEVRVKELEARLEAHSADSAEMRERGDA